MASKRLWVDCDCEHYEHSIRFGYWAPFDDTDETFVYVDTMVEDYVSFWKRLVRAFNYVFCRRRFGTSNETLVSIKNAEKIISFLRDVVDTEKKRKNG